MSIGNAPSALGTLLVQRLDTVLGTTVSQQANLASGARPDAVSQPGQPDRNEAVRNETLRHPQDSINRTAGQLEQHRKQIALGRSDQNPAALLRGMGQTPQSTHTSLGAAARIILALLNHQPGNVPVQARQPLVGQRPISGSPAGQNQPHTDSASRMTGRTTAPQPGTGTTPPLLPQPAAPTTQATGNALTHTAPGPSSQAGAPAATPPLPTTAFPTPGGSSAPDARPGLPLPPAIISLPGALPSSTAIAGQFAQALSQAVQSSGVFYESHLGQLAFGQRTVAQLQSEPQAQHANSTESARQTSSTTQPSHNTSSSNASSSLPGTATTTAPLPSTDLSTIVRQQLESLANQAFSWRGEAWPGTEMSWEIHRRHASQDDAIEDPDYWATRLTLHLPTLGQVSARLTLSGQQVLMRVEAPDSAELLSSNAPALQSRLSALGLQLGQLFIAAQDAEAASPEPFHADPPATR